MDKNIPFNCPVRIPEELIEWLEAMFPQRCKNIGESLEDHMYYAGHANIATFLRAHQPEGARELPQKEKLSDEDLRKQIIAEMDDEEDDDT